MRFLSASVDVSGVCVRSGRRTRAPRPSAELKTIMRNEWTCSGRFLQESGSERWRRKESDGGGECGLRRIAPERFRLRCLSQFSKIQTSHVTVGGHARSGSSNSSGFPTFSSILLRREMIYLRARRQIEGGSNGVVPLAKQRSSHADQMALLTSRNLRRLV